MLRHVTLESLQDQVADGLRPLQDLEVRAHLVRTAEAEEMIERHYDDMLYRAIARENMSGHHSFRWSA